MAYEHTGTSAFEPGSSAQLMMATVDSDHSGLVEAVTAMNVASSSAAATCNEPKNIESGGLDSGYASQISTPDSLKSTFVDRAVAGGKNIWPRPFRKPKQLRPYNKPIPQLTWDRFSDLREQYAEKLNHFTRSLPNCPSVLMTLQVLGEDEESAEPWVFVQCDKSVFKKINNFFKQPLIKIDFEPPQPDNRSPRLRILVCPLKPRQLAKDTDLSSQYDPLASDDSIEIFGNITCIYGDTLCGTHIMNGHSHGMCQATMGGIITVIDEKGKTGFFGMTAGHFLLQASSDKGEDKLDDNLDDDFYAEEHFELDLSSIETNTQDEGETLSPAEAEDKGGKETDPFERLKVGKLSEASHASLEDGRNLDWALIKVDGHFFSLSNISGIHLHDFEERKSSDSETNVIMVSAQGLKTGLLSISLSYIMLPPGTVLIRTYLLSLSDTNTLQPGDSGAWVVDSATGKVYGHVVASDVFGRGYVVPICDSLEDIKKRLSADLVTIPSGADFLNFNVRGSLMEATTPISCRPNLLADLVSPVVDVGLRNVGLPFPAIMPEYPRQFYNSSDLREYPRQSYSSSSLRESPPSRFSSNYSPPSAISSSFNDAPQVPDSGYSSMQTTPHQSPPISSPQPLKGFGTSHNSQGHSVSEVTAMSHRPGVFFSPQSGAVERPIDSESDPTGEWRARKFKEKVKIIERKTTS